MSRKSGRGVTRATKKARVSTKPRVKKASVPKDGMYMGLEFESFCELSCIYFAEELIKLGYVDRIERSPSYMLCDPVQHTYAEQLKRSSKQVTQTICHGVSYTPDFDIYFTEKARGIFFWELSSSEKWEKHLLVAQKVQTHPTIPDSLYKACIEVKPDFSRASTTPKSMQSMKWLFQKHGIYCNLFRPNRIFEGLFVPDKYRLTERGTQRLLKFTPLTLQQYLSKLNKNGKPTGSRDQTATKGSSKRQYSKV